jgi:hypothetical protein
MVFSSHLMRPSSLCGLRYRKTLLQRNFITLRVSYCVRDYNTLCELSSLILQDIRSVLQGPRSPIPLATLASVIAFGD